MLRWAGVALGTAVVEASNIWVVDDCGKSLGDQVAVQTCSGLFNRDETVAGASFVLGLTSADARIGWQIWSRLLKRLNCLVQIT